MPAKKNFLVATGISPGLPEERSGHRIHITRIVPMTDQVLLAAFRDKVLNMNDVTFLLNRIDGLHPRSEPEQFKAFLATNPPCIAEWENEIGSAEPEPGEDAPEVTLDIPHELFEDLNELCSMLEITLPQLVRATLRFCVNPETQDAAAQWSELTLIPPPRHPEESEARDSDTQ